MITTLKINDENETKWMSFKDETGANKFIEEYQGDYGETFSIEMLVDFSELKNYKEKYQEIYSTLFSSYTNQDSKSSENSTEEIVFTVKYIKNDEIKSVTKVGLEKALALLSNLNTDYTSQLLVNIGEVQDYKEKYDEFYSLMLSNFQKKNNVKEEVKEEGKVNIL